jgi:hypothetical protein
MLATHISQLTIGTAFEESFTQATSRSRSPMSRYDFLRRWMQKSLASRTCYGGGRLSVDRRIWLELVVAGASA